MNESELDELEQVLAVPEPAEGPPAPLDNLDALDSCALAEEYQLREAWHGRLAYLLAGVRTELLQVAVAKAEMKARVGSALREQLFSNREIRDRLALEPGYRQLVAREQRLEAARNFLKARLEHLMGEVRMLSRMIEVRRQEVEITTGGSKALRRALLNAATLRRPRRQA